MKAEIGDTIFINHPHEFPVLNEPASDPEYVKHVSCEGARFHVIMLDSLGPKCSCSNCIINKARKERPQ